jgi:formate hydrogenlyase subunit 3/multisubunit Na+/H+ antiporter MnhD subunit
LSLQFSPWWLIFTPLPFVPLIYLLRRWGVGVWLATLVCLGSAYLVTLIPQEQVFRLLGRPLFFNQVWAYTIALLFVATAFLFILSRNISQGWTFYPFGLIILTLFSLAVASRHLGIIALIVEMAVLLSVFIIQGGRLGSVRASLRFLVMMTLAAPLFLLAAWQGDLYRANLENPTFLAQMGLLVAGGFGLWLGAAPLHGWLSAVAMEAKPGIAAFIFITFPTAATLILLHHLAYFPRLVDMPHAQEIIILTGLFSVAVGGLFASIQRAFGPLMGYTTLFDLGNSLVALGLGTQDGLTIILLAILVRVLALLLISSSIAFIQHLAGGDSFEQARGLAHRWPVPTIGLMIGGATLAGAPFTAGFVSRWLLLQPLAEMHAVWPLLVFLGGLGVTTGYIRGLRALLDKKHLPHVLAEKWGLNLLIVTLAALCVGLGLFPQAILQTVKELALSMHIPIL